ncbi:ABC transporter permease [Clostridium oryzae]|uniref:Oligopeptide transport system permease protein OppB n=1 Tax=Clostridium oryzae TaxID=1450648 RepID=A0A1V4I9D0_9CLOT|nr:ABC transporter permease [Clostridium oryzae]OPJ56539.1 oligopeptide transport system permease protein OppB [Clostridium oryzae]
MSKYLLKRIVSSIFTLWVVITITFLLAHAIPGGPFDSDKKLPPEIKKNLMIKYHQDKPLYWQYGNYLKNLLTLDMGPSTAQKGTTVNDIIGRSFPVSARLGTVAVLVSLAFGIFMGIISALNQNRWPDKLVMFVSILGVTIPSFVMGTMFIYIFAEKLRIFPVFGLTSPKHYVLPAIGLAGFSCAFITRLVRSSLLDVIRQDFIRNARAKGLSETAIIFRHALINAILPVITYLGTLIAGILTGSFIIEKIFTIPGLGRSFVDSISNRDYTLILGVTIFYSAFLIISNLIVDILYALIDPRIKLEG